MKDIRLMQMERYLSEVGYATIQQLCEKFEIHPNTARSDIKELIERGVAEKKYGGVGYTSTKLPESNNIIQQPVICTIDNVDEYYSG